MIGLLGSKLGLFAGAALLALGAIGVQTVRLAWAQADSAGYKASADTLLHDLKTMDAVAKANAELVGRMRVAAEKTAANLRVAQTARAATAAELRKLTNDASATNAQLAACLALPLPPAILLKLP